MTLPQDTPRRMFISVDGQEDLENGYCHLLYLDLEAVCPNYKKILPPTKRAYRLGPAGRGELG